MKGARLIRPLLWVLFVANLFVQATLAVEWIGKRGFFGSIWFWLTSGRIDPILGAATLDFSMVIALVGIALLYDYPSNRSKTSLGFFLWCLIYVIFPSIGIFIYILLIRPERATPASTLKR